MKTKWKKKARAFWKWIRPMVLTGALVLVGKSVLADWYSVPTGSMKPTIVEGDRLFVNKLSYGLRFPLSSRWVRSISSPICRASIKSVSPRRSRYLPFVLFLARNHRQTGICVV